MLQTSQACNLTISNGTETYDFTQQLLQHAYLFLSEHNFTITKKERERERFSSLLSGIAARHALLPSGTDGSVAFGLVGILC